MKFVKIAFDSRDVAIRAYHGLAQRGKVISLPEGQLIVPEPALQWLASERITPIILQWLNQDRVNHTLRNSAVPRVE